MNRGSSQLQRVTHLCAKSEYQQSPGQEVLWGVLGSVLDKKKDIFPLVQGYALWNVDFSRVNVDDLYS